MASGTGNIRENEPFDFEYIGLKRFEANGGLAIFGRLHSGRIRQGGPIALPTTDGGAVLGRVSHFQESFHDWIGLPFYHTVVPGTAGFAIFIAADSYSPNILCPGRAWNPEAE